jgi:hypothetical protein
MSLLSVLCADLTLTLIWQLEGLDAYMGQRATQYRALALSLHAPRGKGRD